MNGANPIRLVACLVALAASGAGAATPFSDGFTPSSFIHVATNGNDTTGNGSAEQPYRTIDRAVDDATPGAAITIRPGIYAGGTFIHDLAGTDTAPIWIRGESPTNRPVIQGSAEGLHLTRVRYLVVENLEVSGSTANGINCDDGGEYDNPEATRYVVFNNLYIHDIGGGGNQDGLKMSGVYDFWILDSEITRCGGAGSGSGIDMVGCHRGVIRGNHLHELSGNAVQCKGGTTDVEIRGCRIIDAGHRGINIGGSTGFEFFRPPLSEIEPNVEASNIRVFANFFQGCTSSVAFVGCVDSVVANNTIHDPGRWILRILQETTSADDFEFLPCGDNEFNNNIVYYNRGLLSTHVNIGPDTDPDSFTFAHNLWYAHDNPALSAPSLPGAVTGQIAGVDPLLAAPASGDYSITLASPAATNGIGPALAPRDFSGELFLNPPSRGALEITGDIDSDGLPDVWELRHMGSIAFDADDDPDDDGLTNLDELIAGTLPQDAASVLRLFHPVMSEGGVMVRWQGGRTAVQYLERADHLDPAPANWSVLLTNHPPTDATNEVMTEIHERSYYRLRAMQP